MSKLGRNDPCHCGSGKKYKKCCIEKDAEVRPLGATPGNVSASYRDFAPAGAAHAAYEPPDEPAEPDEPEGPPDPEVDAWWESFQVVAERKDPGELLRAINQLLDENPTLARRAGLEDFLIGGLHLAHVDSPESAAFDTLMRRMRREFPEIYRQAFQYFDTSLIVKAILSGKRDEVPAFFDIFKADPSADAEQLVVLCNILLASNSDAAYLDLTKAVARDVKRLVGVKGCEPVVDGAIVDAYLPALNARDTSAKGAAAVATRIKDLRLDFAPPAAEIEKEMGQTFGPFPVADAAAFKKQTGRMRYYTHLLRHFTAWLHDHAHLSWPASQHFGLSVASFFSGVSPRTAAQPFRVDAQELEAYLNQSLRRLTAVDGVSAFSFLQGLYWFADYLAKHGVAAESTEPLQKLALEFAAKLPKLVGPNDPGPQLFPDLTHYKWAQA